MPLTGPSVEYSSQDFSRKEVPQMPGEILMNKSQPNGIEFDDGEWHAATLGHFIALLVDSGSDPAVLFRVVEDGPFLDSGSHARKWELVVIPNGLVLDVMREYNVDHAHKVLKAFLENGLVK
jgi:hypothetical protein